MTITRIESGARMSEAVIHGGKVYLSGVVAEQGTSVTEQTRDILAQIDALLAQAGSDKTRLLKANIWLTDIATIGEMNTVRKHLSAVKGGRLAAAAAGKVKMRHRGVVPARPLGQHGLGPAGAHAPAASQALYCAYVTSCVAI